MERARKVVVVGDGGVGKTTFVRAFFGHGNVRRYIATLGVEVTRMVFNVDQEGMSMEFDVWDMAGSERVGLLRDPVYYEAAACIVMFDLTSRSTLRNVRGWLRDINRLAPAGIPVCIVGNKLDVTSFSLSKPALIHRQLDSLISQPGRNVRVRRAALHVFVCLKKLGLGRDMARQCAQMVLKRRHSSAWNGDPWDQQVIYFETSCKASYNMTEPWTFLARKLTKQPELNIVTSCIDQKNASVSQYLVDERIAGFAAAQFTQEDLFDDDDFL